MGNVLWTGRGREGVRNLIVAFVFFLISSSSLIAQDTTNTPYVYSDLFQSRYRIQLGFVGISYQPGENNRGILPLLNFNYRFMMTHADTSHSFHPLDLVSEIGINEVVLPYVKIGPELHLSKNIYADVHGGVMYIPGSLFYPFIGAGMGFSIKIDESSSIEIEGGYNVSVAAVKYIVFGYTFK